MTFSCAILRSKGMKQSFGFNLIVYVVISLFHLNHRYVYNYLVIFIWNGVFVLFSFVVKLTKFLFTKLSWQYVCSVCECFHRISIFDKPCVLFDTYSNIKTNKIPSFNPKLITEEFISEQKPQISLFCLHFT